MRRSILFSAAVIILLSIQVELGCAFSAAELSERLRTLEEWKKNGEITQKVFLQEREQAFYNYKNGPIISPDEVDTDLLVLDKIRDTKLVDLEKLIKLRRWAIDRGAPSIPSKTYQYDIVIVPFENKSENSNADDSVYKRIIWYFEEKNKCKVVPENTVKTYLVKHTVNTMNLESLKQLSDDVSARYCIVGTVLDYRINQKFSLMNIFRSCGTSVGASSHAVVALESSVFDSRQACLLNDPKIVREEVNSLHLALVFKFEKRNAVLRNALDIVVESMYKPVVERFKTQGQGTNTAGNTMNMP